MSKRKFSNNIVFRFIREAYAELKKVVWPKKKEVVNKTLIVVVAMVLSALIIGILDYGLSQGINVLINIK